MSRDRGYRCSHVMEGKGEQYDSYYVDDPWQAFMWRREQACIDELISGHLGSRKIRLLDFACGSGRITGFLETRAASCTGIDVSEPMLERARQKLPNVELINADLTRSDVLSGRKFDLITAFRFFANAEDELRTDVMQRLPEYLDRDGFILFNNHHIPEAIFFRAQNLIARFRRKRMDNTIRMMSLAETMTLVEEAGLKPVATRHVGFLHLPRLNPPPGLVEAVEDIAQRTDWMARRCESVMVLCSR